MIPYSDNSRDRMLYLDGLHTLVLEPLRQRCPKPDWQQPEGFLAAAYIPGKWQVYETISSNFGKSDK